MKWNIFGYLQLTEELEKIKQEMEDRGSSMTDGGEGLIKIALSIIDHRKSPWLLTWTSLVFFQWKVHLNKVTF